MIFSNSSILSSGSRSPAPITTQSKVLDLRTLSTVCSALSPRSTRQLSASYGVVEMRQLHQRHGVIFAHMKQLPSPLLVITDRHQARHSIAAIAEEVGQGGGRWLLLRAKDLEPRERRDLAARLAKIARRHGMHLSVSPAVPLAPAHGASVPLQSASAVG